MKKRKDVGCVEGVRRPGSMYGRNVETGVEGGWLAGDGW